jgi:hypothetical protein
MNSFRPACISSIVSVAATADIASTNRPNYFFQQLGEPVRRRRWRGERAFLVGITRTENSPTIHAQFVRVMSDPSAA